MSQKRRSGSKEQEWPKRKRVSQKRSSGPKEKEWVKRKRVGQKRKIGPKEECAKRERVGDLTRSWYGLIDVICLRIIGGHGFVAIFSSPF